MFDLEPPTHHNNAAANDLPRATNRIRVRPLGNIDGIVVRAPASYVSRTPREPSLDRPPYQPLAQKQLPIASSGRPSHYSKLQIVLVGLACFVFILGLIVTVQTIRTNHNVAAQVSALSQASNKSSSSNVPSVTKPPASNFNSYQVAPDLPRYIKIPKLGVNARVLQVGVTGNGTLGTPNNIYDTAWYQGSAKPGQLGDATLVDGHVSSWTAHGVFYGIKTLVTGDTIQIVRGDGTLLSYRVVKTQVYSAAAVDMQAALAPIVKGKSGLNLITCTGQVKPGTSEFSERVVVFAEQV